MTTTTTDKPQKPLASILGHEPTPALREVLRQLQECSSAELNWLKLDGVRAVQLSRIEIVTVPN